MSARGQGHCLKRKEEGSDVVLYPLFSVSPFSTPPPGAGGSLQFFILALPGDRFISFSHSINAIYHMTSLLFSG